MTKQLLTALFFVLGVIVFSFGCDKVSNPCLEPRRYFLKLKTYKPADTGSLGVDSTLPSAVVGYVDTPILFYDTVNTGDFSAPLSSVVDSTRWFIMPDTADKAGIDTITFYYERELSFLSTACGYTYVFLLNDVRSTNNRIDSVRIETAQVTNNTEPIHVKVFY